MANETKTTRYPWADAPEDAFCAATDANGDAVWYLWPKPNNSFWVAKAVRIGTGFDTFDWRNSLEINPKFTNQAPQLSPDFTEWNTQMLGEMTAMVAEQVKARVSDALYREGLRAQFAAQAMAGHRAIGAAGGAGSSKMCARWAVEDADALLAALYPSPKAEAEK